MGTEIDSLIPLEGGSGGTPPPNLLRLLDMRESEGRSVEAARARKG